MDLIERLRKPIDYKTPDGVRMVAVHAYLMEAADEIERLQTQITAMTKDMESVKPWRELQHTNMAVLQANAELQRENEELRKAKIEIAECWNKTTEELVDRNEELAALKALSNDEFARAERSDALKAQSMEPVKFGKSSSIGHLASNIMADCGHSTENTRLIEKIEGRLWEYFDATPPAATALVEDFKRRAVEVCQTECDEYGVDTNGWYVAKACKEAIESLPLIEDFNQGEK